MNTLSAAKKLTGHVGVVDSIAVSAGRGLFATGANRHQGVERNVRIWNSANGEFIGEIVTELNSIFGLAISPDARLLAVGGGGAVFGLQWEYTGGIEVWSLEEKQIVVRFGQEDLFFVTSIVFSPDGEWLLTSSSPRPSTRPLYGYKRVRLWRASDFKKVSAFGEFEGSVAAACFSPSGQSVVFAVNPASVATRVRLNLLATPRWQSFIPAFLKNKMSVQFHDANSMTPFVGIRNLCGGHEEAMLDLPNGRVEGVAFSPDGHMIASCGNTLLTWNYERREVIKEFAQRSFSRCVAFSNRGGILATGGGYRSQPGGPDVDCGVNLWDSESGRLIAFLPHENPVHSLAFLPDQNKLVAGGESGELLLWEVESR